MLVCRIMCVSVSVSVSARKCESECECKCKWVGGRVGGWVLVFALGACVCVRVYGYLSPSLLYLSLSLFVCPSVCVHVCVCVCPLLRCWQDVAGPFRLVTAGIGSSPTT